MSLGAHPFPDPYLDPRDQLRHDLKSPLTTISGRAQLLTRMVRRTSSLTELERGTMLDGLAAIETTVRTLVTRFDARELIDRSGEPRRTLAD